MKALLLVALVLWLGLEIGKALSIYRVNPVLLAVATVWTLLLLAGVGWGLRRLFLGLWRHVTGGRS